MKGFCRFTGLYRKQKTRFRINLRSPSPTSLHARLPRSVAEQLRKTTARREAMADKSASRRDRQTGILCELAMARAQAKLWYPSLPSVKETKRFGAVDDRLPFRIRVIRACRAVASR